MVAPGRYLGAHAVAHRAGPTHLLHPVPSRPRLLLLLLLRPDRSPGGHPACTCIAEAGV